MLKELKKRPLDYFKMFYADTAMFGASTRSRAGSNSSAPDHVLFASDAPFDPEKGPVYIRSTLEDLETIDLSEHDRQLILEGNAQRLLHLPVSGREV